jgi:peptidyl-prolyl cis-trans isomerase D
MISWIQSTFQRHLKLVFGVLLAVSIVSFVFTIGASPGVGPADQQTIKREFFGYNLNSTEDQQRVMGDAGLSASLQVGYGLEAEQIQNYAFQRVASLELAKKIGLPVTNTGEIADQIKTLRAFTDDDGKFDPKRYATFRDNLKTNPRLTEADIARVIGDDVKAEKIQKLLGGPGYVLSADVKSQLARADTSWSLIVANVDYASFNPEIPQTDTDLTKYFEENSFRYEVPPKISASYVEFPATDYLASVALSDSEVQAYYDSNPSRFPKPTSDPKVLTPIKTDAVSDFAAVRPQVELALRFERARRLAAKAASDFVFGLYELKVTADSPALAKFIAAHKHPQKILAPFTRESGPAEFGGDAAAAAQEAFKLSKERVYSEAVATNSGAAVLFWKDTLPARKPALSEVKSKIASDFSENEKRKRFVELGRTLRALIENRLKAGDTFEKAAVAAVEGSSAKIELKSIPAFSLRNRTQDVDFSILSATERLEKGQVSDLLIAVDKGTFVYVAAKQVPDFSVANPLFTETQNQIATYTARLGSSAYLAEMVEAELKRSEPPAK